MTVDPFPSTSRPDPEQLLEHASWLRRLARALTLDEASADDLVQDALGAALTSRVPIRDLRAFLGGVVRRRSAEVRRTELRRRRREQAHAKDRETTLSGVDQAAERVETMRILLEELQELPPAQRDTLTLRFVDGLEPVEIARRAGLSPATVRAHVSRGLAALRDRLDRRRGGRASWTAAFVPWSSTPAMPEAGFALSASARAVAPDGARAAFTSGFALMSTKFVAAVLVLMALLTLWLSLEHATGSGSRAEAKAGDRSTAAGPRSTGADAVALDRGADLTLRTAALASPRTASPTEDAQATAGQRVEGLVVDALTGEPVPSIELFVGPSNTLRASPHGVLTQPSTGDVEHHAPNGSAHVWTDGSGAFSSDARLEAGEVSVIVKDGHGATSFPSRAPRRAFPFEGPIEVLVGPTFHFATTLPAGVALETLTARFLERSESRQGAPTTSVRAGEFPWVRFGPEVTEANGPGPWVLEVSDEVGFWQATVEVRRKTGIEPHPLEFWFEARGALHFTVAQANGSLAPLAIMDLDSLEGQRVHPVQRIYLEPAQGEPVMQGHALLLQPGPYRWRAGTETGEVLVVAGKVVSVPIEMSDDGAWFDIDVELDTSAVEDFDPSLGTTFVVMDANNMKRSFHATPERIPGGPAGRWRLRIVDLPPGRWNLVPVAEFSDVRWAPEQVALEPARRRPCWSPVAEARMPSSASPYATRVRGSS